MGITFDGEHLNWVAASQTPDRLDIWEQELQRQLPSGEPFQKSKALALLDKLYFEAIGFATSGEAGSRLAPHVGLSVPPTTLLRRIMECPLPVPQTIPHTGIDDFAFRRGRNYGTLLVDLDSHRVVDVLPDRTTQSAATWLATHPEVEILSCDRGNDYAAAARQAAPQEKQVADRPVSAILTKRYDVPYN